MYTWYKIQKVPKGYAMKSESFYLSPLPPSSQPEATGHQFLHFYPEIVCIFTPRPKQPPLYFSMVFSILDILHK